MWVLKKKDSEVCAYLAPGKMSYAIGRFGVDIVLREDASISRTHATISFENNSLLLEDAGSKYGTYVNKGIATNARLSKNEKLEIHENDTIRFGLMQNVWSVGKIKFVSLLSALSQEENRRMQQMFKELGVELLDSWSSECTHLTMNSVSITIKLLYALVEELPIVTTKFWDDMFVAVRDNKSSLPNAVEYAPTSSDAAVDISRRTERRSLFRGKTFVFMNAKQLQMYGPLIMKAGGICKNLNTGVQKALLIKPNVVVVQYLPSTQSQSSQMTISWISDFLTQNSKRMIPEYEIGLAIVHCSTVQYCNACHKMADCLLPVEEKQPTVGFTVFVENTAQSCSEKSSNSTEIVVPETDQSVAESMQASIDDMMESQQSEIIERAGKRKRGINQIAISDDSDADETVAKKPNVSDNSSSLAKRATRSSRLNGANEKKELAVLSDDEDENDMIPTQPFENQTTVTRSGVVEEKEVKKGVVFPNRSSQTTSKSISNGALESDEDDMMLFDFGEEQCTAMNSIKSANSTATAKSKVAAKTIKAAEFSDDDELFAFADSPKGKSGASPKPTTRGAAAKPVAKSPLISKRSPKPLPITTTTKSRGTRSIAGFVQKSQPVAPPEDTNQARNNNEPDDGMRKRKRIPVIGDDDDDDNLFDFLGEENSKKVRLNDTNHRVPHNIDSDDEELFNFKEQPDKTNSKSIDVDDDDVVQAPGLTLAANKTASFQMPKPKILPKKVNISDWIICDGVKKETKRESLEDVPDNAATPIKQEDDEAAIARQQWLDSLKGGFEVRFCDLSISRNCVNGQDSDKSYTSSISGHNTTGQKNFKAFVKKQNLHPQQRVIKLCPKPLPGRA